MCRFVPVILTGWLVCAAVAVGHEEIDRQIAQLSDQLAESPGEPGLLLRRADLHRRHLDWAAALEDYRLAEQRGGDSAIIALGRAQLELDRDQPSRSLEIARGLLEDQPGHASARLIEARSLAALGRRAQALDAYDRAIGDLRRPQPDHYLERARLQAGEGERPDPEAIAGLDAGIERLGGTISLHRQALAWERQLGRNEEALARCEVVLGRSPGNIPWLIFRAEILSEVGREEDARTAWEEAGAALKRLPASRSQTEAAHAWRQAIARGLSADPRPP